MFHGAPNVQQMNGEPGRPAAWPWVLVWVPVRVRVRVRGVTGLPCFKTPAFPTQAVGEPLIPLSPGRAYFELLRSELSILDARR
jgi:hypothetical protein